MLADMEPMSLLVSQFYAAATDPSRWDVALADLQRVFAARTASLHVTDRGQRRVKARNAGAESPAYYEYHRTLDFVAAVVESAPPGAIFTGTEVLEPHVRSGFYADRVAPSEYEDGVFAALGTGVPTWLCIAGRQRPMPFADADVRLLRRILPHLQQALRMEQEFRELAGERALAVDLLDQLADAAVVVGRDAGVRFENAAARSLLRGSDGLSVDRHGVLTVPSSQRVHAGLEQLIRRACPAAEAGGPPRVGGSLAVPRPQGRRPYLVHVVPLGEGRSAGAAVVIVDPERRERPTIARRLQQLFDLTAAETAVACIARRGLGAQATADELHLSTATVRTHLHHIFRKTGTSRQAELTYLLTCVESPL